MESQRVRHNLVTDHACIQRTKIFYAMWHSRKKKKRKKNLVQSFQKAVPQYKTKAIQKVFLFHLVILLRVNSSQLQCRLSFCA